MAIVYFSIRSGQAPFTVELTPSSIPIRTYNTIGDYGIADVPDGIYTLIIRDSNNCVYEKEIIVDPFVTTTTTTIIENDSIVVGNAQDPLVIFNPVATNRNSFYDGYPNQYIVNLFLWFKTLDGKPLASSKTLTYAFNALSPIYGPVFSFIELSDQIHAEVTQTQTGPSSSIGGSIELKAGFIETYFNYLMDWTIAGGIPGGTAKRFTIDIGSPSNDIYTGIPTKDDAGTTFGITTLEIDRITIEYGEI